MPYAAAFITLFCVVASAGVAAGIAVAAFGNPSSFVKWLTPLEWLLRRSGAWKRSIEISIAYSLGMFSMLLLLGFCFCLGGLMATALFNLWTSPFAAIVLP